MRGEEVQYCTHSPLSPNVGIPKEGPQACVRYVRIGSHEGGVMQRNAP